MSKSASVRRRRAGRWEADVAALTDSEWEHLARDLARRVDIVAPGWTNQNETDPGVTIAELMAFLAETLLGRPERSRRAVTRLGELVTELDTAHELPCREISHLTRVRYFHGRLLSAADFELEQDYVRSKQRRHNRLLHGTGIVSGLRVTVESGHGEDGPRVAVSPGLAIGPDGEELVVCERLTSTLTPDGSPGYVTLRLVDRPTGVVPAPEGEEASQLEEVVEMAIVADPPPSHLAVARVERRHGEWRLDPGFEVLRVGRP